MAMSYSRWKQMLQSVPANARKVYDVIPIAEADGWSYSQIHQELQRTGRNMRTEVVMGCVAALKDAGLVYEASQYRFRRTAHKAAAPDPMEIIVLENTDVAPTQPKPASSPPSATDKLASLATRVKTMSDVAIQLHHEAVKIHDELVNLAVDLEENSEVNAEALKKLAAAREAFKALGLA